MKSSSGPRHPPSGRWLDHPWIFIVALVFAWAVSAGNSWTKLRVIEATSALSLPKMRPPAIDAASPTGYRDGLRRVIWTDVDSCQWVMHAQRMLQEKTWRVRWMPDDNFPAGREMHWSHPLLWWLVGLGALTGWVAHLPAAAGIEVAAQWGSMVLLAILMTVIPWTIRKRFGWLAAGLLAIAMATIYPFASLFFVGCADHHGLAAVAVMTCLLFLASGGAGWVSAPAAKESPKAKPATAGAREYRVSAVTARRWFMAGGLAAGVALWISAATAVPVLVGLGLGVLSAAFLYPRASGSNGLVYDPGLWRIWAATSAGSALLFYLLEYFPAHLGMRLEVNHPLYALALLGAGEILFRLTRWRTADIAPWSEPRGAILTLGALASVLALPAVVSSAGEQVFRLGDTFLWTLHRDYIAEFKPLVPRMSRETLATGSLLLGPLPLLLFAVLRLLLSKHLGSSWKTVLLLPLAAAVVMTALSFWQTRWYYVANGLWLAVLPIVIGCVTDRSLPVRYAWWERIVAAVFLGVVAFQMPRIVWLEVQAAMSQRPVVPPEGERGVVIRDVAYRLRARAGDEIPVVLSAPTTTTWLMYYGGLRGIGTLYWENLAGLTAAAHIYAAPTNEEAQRLIDQHHVSYVVLFSQEHFAWEYPRLLRGLPRDARPNDTFSAGVALDSGLPPWAQPIPYFLPGKMGVQREWLALYDVRPAWRQPTAPVPVR